jgi:hypothetical protein
VARDPHAVRALGAVRVQVVDRDRRVALGAKHPVAQQLALLVHRCVVQDVALALRERALVLALDGSALQHASVRHRRVR